MGVVSLHGITTDEQQIPCLYPCFLRTYCFLGGLARRLDKIYNLFLIFNQRLKLYIIITTFNNGSLGSGIDEERSEMR